MASDKAVGAQFDILDKALAARLHELLARPFIARQDYDAWMTGFNQLRNYANANSNVAYVASQWEMEQRNYQGWPERLLSKVRIANPVNYDTSISVRGNRGDCGCSSIPQLPYSPLQIPAGNAGMIPTRGGSTIFLGGGTPSLGDSARGFFDPISSIDLPMPPLLQEIKKDTMTGIIVALVVGAILFGIHHLNKKWKIVNV